MFIYCFGFRDVHTSIPAKMIVTPLTDMNGDKQSNSNMTNTTTCSGLEKYAVVTEFFYIHFTILELKDIVRYAEFFVVYGFLSYIRVPLCNEMIQETSLLNDIYLTFLECLCLVMIPKGQ